MRPLLGHLAVALAVTLVVGGASGGGWHFLVGAVLALALWMMLFLGSFGRPPGEGTERVELRHYAVSAAVALALGYAMYLVGDGNAAFWSVGFVFAGVLTPAATRAREASTGDGADTI
ncbi:hypothetical protein [Nocardioides sp. zg-1228]|uniref:hypothetical protein n=1 Tax=Nocardioides sp. zg-1228 TaxID=2763008 RepID=UPI001642B97A|nr:hypothetical protein [Nocardioides sp. zg-1228]MBC2934163.1 hypothetical protein [Nocardioides sp. zg-1228]QSF58908.1 hypothetical protein JX575_06955 [Nocardioides sp. zg-1228]